ncbi:MAG TPA: SRPBCC domain-containing protein [Acidimicrobiales bacterium]|jgi:uncharacterized protein YndB with AHSA1/START domain
MTSRVLVALRIAAPPSRVFEAFTTEIGEWWRPNGLFQPTRRRAGRLCIEPGVDGRLLETHPDGAVDEIGRIRAWEPPVRLVFTWRPTSFAPSQETEVHVRFEPVNSVTRVVVEHFGWDGIPQEHAARHGFPLFVFQQRLAEWWRDLVESLAAHTSCAPDERRSSIEEPRRSLESIRAAQRPGRWSVR